MRSETINQRHIARSLNLSAATISRSFRNHPDITSETRERVLEAAARMGYQKINKNDKTNVPEAGQPVIGVLVAESAGVTAVHQATGMMIAGLSLEAAKRNATVVIHHLRHKGGSDLLDNDTAPPLLRSNMAKALVLLHRFNPEVVRKLSARIPCVTVAHYVQRSDADHIDSDHMGALSELIDHVYDLGHRRIGFVGRVPHSAITRSRCSSFLQAVQHAGLPWDPSLVVPFPLEEGTDADLETQFDRIGRLVHSGVTAWQCDSDGTAYRVLNGLKARGIEAPHDVSVAGYDGFMQPGDGQQLTTVRVPFIEMGSAALRRGLARMERSDGLPQQILLRCKFVKGATTGPVGA